MDGLATTGELGRRALVANPVMLDGVDDSLPRRKRDSEIVEIVAKLITAVQLGCAAAVVLSELLLSESSNTLTTGQLVNSVLVLCGFAILAMYWSRRRALAGASAMFKELAARGGQIAAVILLSTFVATNLAGASWEYLNPGRTFVFLLATTVGGAALLAVVMRLMRDSAIRSVVVFSSGSPALQLAQDIRRALPRANVCVYPIEQLAARPEWPEPAALTSFHPDPKLVELAPDVAVLSASACDHATVARVTAQLAPLSIDVLAFGPHGGTLALGPLATLAGQVLVRVFPKPLTARQRLLKRCFDFIVSAALLAMLSPLLLAVALLVKMDSRGPILFRQPRTGYKGSVFTVFKFRTMRVEATDVLANRPTVSNDPRLTKVGAFLRKSSIDELPQLFNVLLGSMSLVGPRPHAGNGSGFGRVVSNYHARHRVKPGITGLAQVLGWRGPTDSQAKIEQRVANDMRYISHWSFAQDIWIIGRTFFAVWGKNAF
jgi:exopolysaccharide biosynthesis polyprenyl glycosylphosphotransferase